MLQLRIKPLLWTLAALAGVYLLVAVTVTRGHPDEQRARHDFLAEHPTYSIAHITTDEQEVIAKSFRIFYRIPGESTLHEELRQYLNADGKWHISHRLQKQ